jgi:hypothetical protein
VQFIIFLYTNSSVKLCHFLHRNSIPHFFASGQLSRTCLCVLFPEHKGQLPLSVPPVSLRLHNPAYTQAIAFISFLAHNSTYSSLPDACFISRLLRAKEMTPMNFGVRSRDCLLSFIFLRVFYDTLLISYIHTCMYIRLYVYEPIHNTVLSLR